jgi:hypothetical protein
MPSLRSSNSPRCAHRPAFSNAPPARPPPNASHPCAVPQGLQLRDSVAQFSHTMTAQADLRVEAAHLRRFSANFEVVGASVVVPRPVEGAMGGSVGRQAGWVGRR